VDTKDHEVNPFTPSRRERNKNDQS